MNDKSSPLYEFLSNLFSQREEEKSQQVNKPFSVVLFTHRQADPDALCAAAGLSLIMEKMLKTKPVTKIVSPQGASSLGLSVCRKLDIQFAETLTTDETQAADILVALDVGDATLLQPFLNLFVESPATKILIDHHGTSNHQVIHEARISSVDEQVPGNSELFVDFATVDKEATSTCEVVTESFPVELLDKRTCETLLVGLLFDSQHLGLATAQTLEAALKLVRQGAEIEFSKNILRTRPDRSEIVARIKAAQRLKFIEVGRYVFMFSEVSSFQASVARALIDIGGDVGIAFGVNNKEVRISIRSTQRFAKETGIDLGQILSEFAQSKTRSSKEMQLVEVSGGGHSTAASLACTGEKADVIMEELLIVLKERLPH